MVQAERPNRNARTCDAEQHLMLRAGQNAFSQLCNRLRLVTSGLVIGDEFKCHTTTLKQPNP